jgi:hypothetical protein
MSAGWLQDIRRRTPVNGRGCKGLGGNLEIENREIANLEIAEPGGREISRFSITDGCFHDSQPHSVPLALQLHL